MSVRRYDVLVWIEQAGSAGVDADELAEQFDLAPEEAVELLTMFMRVGMVRWNDETDRYRGEGQIQL